MYEHINCTSFRFIATDTIIRYSNSGRKSTEMKYLMQMCTFIGPYLPEVETIAVDRT